MYSDVFKRKKKERMNEFNVSVLVEGRELWDIKQKTWKATQYLEKNTKLMKVNSWLFLPLEVALEDVCRLQ